MRSIKQSVKVEGILLPVTEEELNYVPVPGGTPDKVIEAAGRTCYKSEDKITDVSSDDFIRMVCKRQHESVLEHSAITIRIVTDRGISHELVRHRLLAVSQESTRYVNYSKEKHGKGDIQFILPEGLSTAQAEFFLQAYSQEEQLYNQALELGCTPQQARDVLPNGVKTELVITGNFREMIHILSLRLDKPAHPKMRRLAKLLWNKLKKASPVLFNQERFANLCADLE
jgi:thymidylate synthase (FAD)